MPTVQSAPRDSMLFGDEDNDTIYGGHWRRPAVGNTNGDVFLDVPGDGLHGDSGADMLHGEASGDDLLTVAKPSKDGMPPAEPSLTELPPTEPLMISDLSYSLTRNGTNGNDTLYGSNSARSAVRRRRE